MASTTTHNRIERENSCDAQRTQTGPEGKSTRERTDHSALTPPELGSSAAVPAELLEELLTARSACLLLEELLEATAATTSAAERATLLEKDGLTASAKAAATWTEGRATLARVRVVGVVAGVEASSEFCQREVDGVKGRAEWRGPRRQIVMDNRSRQSRKAREGPQHAQERTGITEHFVSLVELRHLLLATAFLVRVSLERRFSAAKGRRAEPLG